MELILDKEIFNECYLPYLDCVTPIQIFYGGASSGKSSFEAQRCVYDVAQGKRNYLVLRNVANTIRSSVFNEVLNVISAFKLNDKFDVNRSDMVITCKGAGQKQIIFRGLDDVEKLKSAKPLNGVFTDIWGEEATDYSEASFNQLPWRLRGRAGVPKRITLTFNPIYKLHWICKRFFNGENITLKHTDKLLIFKTTYTDNKFLDDDDIVRIEDAKLGDPYYWDVYALGNWGVLGQLIFTKWSTADLSDMDFDDFRNGLDFGYSNDPAALSRSARKKDKIYVLPGIYSTGLTNEPLAEAIRPFVNKEIVWCDSAEPKSIQELKDFDISAMAVRKRLGKRLSFGRKSSVLHGIQWLQAKEFIVDESFQPAINELSTYTWQEDKFGNKINVPIDKNNHWIDATRYAYENDMLYNDIPLFTSSMREDAIEKQPDINQTLIDIMEGKI